MNEASRFFTMYRFLFMLWNDLNTGWKMNQHLLTNHVSDFSSALVLSLEKLPLKIFYTQNDGYTILYNKIYKYFALCQDITWCMTAFKYTFIVIFSLQN